MTHEQQLVFAISKLHQEVHSGGFDSYFRYSGGDTALLAHEAAEILGPQWVALVETAIQAMGSPYPSDINERERIVDQLDADSLGHVKAWQRFWVKVSMGYRKHDQLT